MKTIGLTGGIGMGKSTVSAYLEKQGFPVIDTDVIARNLVEINHPVYHKVVARFGSKILNSDGILNRKALAKIVFDDVQARRDLEDIMHPEIKSIWMRKVMDLKSSGGSYCFVVIPLLFETHAVPHFDSVICMACSHASQMTRLLQRGWNELEIRGRVSSQMSIEEKIRLSNFVIWTEGPTDITFQQLQLILPAIREGGIS